MKMRNLVLWLRLFLFWLCLPFGQTHNNATNERQQRQQKLLTTSAQHSRRIRVNETLREVPIAALLMSSLINRGENADTVPYVISTSWVDVQIAVFMAVKHFNERNAVMVPKLNSLDSSTSSSSSCDIQLDLQLYNSEFSPLVAADKMLQAIGPNGPVAFIGEIRSAVSQLLGTLGGVHQVALISPASTSADLDVVDSYPYFGRTVPTNAGDAIALVQYFHSLKVKKFGMAYVQDAYGAAFASAVNKAARPFGMQITSAPFEAIYNEESMDAAVSILLKSNVKYVVAVMGTGVWTYVLKRAVQVGIAGNSDYLWILLEGGNLLGYKPELYQDEELRRGIEHLGFIELHIEPFDAFMQMYNEFVADPSLQQEYLERNDDRHVLEEQINFTKSPPSFSIFGATAYDAVMALGLSMCSVKEEDLSSGPTLFQACLNSPAFVGASGMVSFDPKTGTRSLEGVKYGVFNVLVDHETMSFPSRLTSIIELTHPGDAAMIKTVQPFVYWGGSTTPPLDLPPLTEDLNLIPKAELVLGATLCGVVMAMSLGWAVFTYMYRDQPAVKMAQSEFLYMTCAGTFLMGATMIPLSFQEPLPVNILNGACMAQLWTISFGFTTSFSALFCKMYRLNKLMDKSNRCERVTVNARDVLYPFLILLILNAIVLTTWHAVDPLRWNRTGIEHFIDAFGRPTQSIGICSGKDTTTEGIFLSIFFLLNFSALVIANVESYKARNHPTRFQENQYVALTMLSLLEESLLGLPLLYLLANDPPARYLLSCVMVTLLCVSILLPTFIPKYVRRHVRQQKRDETFRRVSMASFDIKRAAQESRGGLVSQESFMFMKGSERQPMQLQPPMYHSHMGSPVAAATVTLPSSAPNTNNSVVRHTVSESDTFECSNRSHTPRVRWMSEVIPEGPMKHNSVCVRHRRQECANVSLRKPTEQAQWTSE